MGFLERWERTKQQPYLTSGPFCIYDVAACSFGVFRNKKLDLLVPAKVKRAPQQPLNAYRQKVQMSACWSAEKVFDGIARTEEQEKRSSLILVEQASCSAHRILSANRTPTSEIIFGEKFN